GIGLMLLLADERDRAVRVECADALAGAVAGQASADDEVARTSHARILNTVSVWLEMEVLDAVGSPELRDELLLVRSRCGPVCAAVGRLGFQAAVTEASAERAVVETPTCPLRPLVVSRPETAEIDRGLWCGLVAAAVKGVSVEDVECEARGCLDGHASCRL